MTEPIKFPFPKHFDTFLIRDWELDDALGYTAIEFDPEIKEYLGLPEISREEFELTFDPALARGWAIVSLPENAIAGSIDVWRYGSDNKKLELRILLSKEYRMRGFASRAAEFFISCVFKAPWVQGIVGVVHPSNEASLRLLGKLGFELKGKLRAIEHVYELDRDRV